MNENTYLAETTRVSLMDMAIQIAGQNSTSVSDNTLSVIKIYKKSVQAFVEDD